jgi:hypothetical protein
MDENKQKELIRLINPKTFADYGLSVSLTEKEFYEFIGKDYNEVLRYREQTKRLAIGFKTYIDSLYTEYQKGASV